MKYLTKESVLYTIKKCVKNNKKNKQNVHLYYTGHEQRVTGDWCFDDGVVTLDGIMKFIKTRDKNKSIYIYADCCYSGQWAWNLRKCEDR